jgi:hypothetical protein
MQQLLRRKTMSQGSLLAAFSAPLRIALKIMAKGNAPIGKHPPSSRA